MSRKPWLGIVIGAAIAWGFTALGFAVDPRRAAFAYLFAFSVGFTATTGALLFLLIGHAANAKWFVVVRRFCEIAASALPLCLLLFVPVVAFRRQIYPFYDPERLDELARHYLPAKASWFTDPAFLLRSAVYLAGLTAIAEALFRLSKRQDRADDEARVRTRVRLLRASCVLLPIAGFLITFASFDWLMALDPVFYANVYGVYIASGAFMTGVALTTLFAMGSATLTPIRVSVEHLHALGRVLFASVCFWAYIAFVMVLLIWIADQPLEIRYLAARRSGGWQVAAITLVALHFVVPFFALLSRPLKRDPRRLALFCGLLALAHVIDIHFQIFPAFSPGRWSVHWIDMTALFAVAATLIAFAAVRARSIELVPIGDPELARGSQYEAISP
jgi:hypothetical protein